MNMSVATNKALVLFKPDAVAMGQFGKGLRLIAQGLNSRGINFRVASPQVTSVNRGFIERVYTEHLGKGWFESKFAPFMSGTHQDPLVKQAPVVTMAIEAEKGPLDLFSELSAVIGPTFPADDLAQESVRYRLTYGVGGRSSPLYTGPVSPQYNRIHRSANERDAIREINGVYSERIEGTSVIPFCDLADLADPAAESMLRAAFGEIYPGFTRELSRILASDIRRSLPLLAKLNDHFERNLGSSEPSKLDPSEIDPPTPASCFIGIGGAPGSGKTTIATHLIRERGFGSPVHVTTNRHEGDAASSEEYMYVTEPMFMEMLAQGELVGYTSFGELGKKHYSILRASLEDMIADGRSGVVVSGLGCLSGVHDFLNNYPAVSFGSLFVTTPDMLDIVERHKVRGRPGDEERYAYLEAIGRRFASYPELFDRTVVNADLSVSEPEAERFADEVRSRTGQKGKKLPKWPAHVAISQYTFQKAFLNLMEKLGTLDMTNIDTIESGIKSDIEELFRVFMEEARKSIKGRPILTEQDEKDIKLILGHTLAVFSSSLQARIPEENSLMIKRRVSQMAESADPKRTSYNLGRMRDLAGRFTPLENCALPILHDVGKLYEFFKHPEFCGTALDDYEFLDWIPGLTSEQKDILYYGIKCHHLIGGMFTADWSMNSMKNMFSEPRAVSAFKNPDGTVNVDRIKKQADAILLITLCDVPGRPGRRGLRNMLIEQCFNTRDRISGLAERNRTSYDAFLESLDIEAKSMTFERLGLTLGMADHLMDTREGGLEYYTNKVLRSVEESLNRGRLSRPDWALVREKYRFIDEIWYSPYTLWTYVDPETGEYEDEPPAIINTNFVAFTAWILKALEDTGTIREPNPSIEILALSGPDGEYLLGGEKLEAAVLLLDKIVKNNVYGGVVAENNELLFLDDSGKKIQGIKLTISHENDRTHITITLTDLC